MHILSCLEIAKKESDRVDLVNNQRIYCIALEGNCQCRFWSLTWLDGSCAFPACDANFQVLISQRSWESCPSCGYTFSDGWAACANDPVTEVGSMFQLSCLSLSAYRIVSIRACEAVSFYAIEAPWACLRRSAFMHHIGCWVC